MKKIIFIAFLLIGSILILPSSKISATTASEVRQQIENTNNQIAELDRQIAQYQQQIAQTAEEKNTLAKLIKELNLTRSKLVAEKTKTQKKINATGLVIKNLDSNISAQEQSILNSKESLARMIADVYISDNFSIAERLLSKSSLAEASNEYNNILAINKKVREHLKEVRIKKEGLIVTKTQKETEKDKLESLKENLNLQQKAVESTKSEKDKVLVATKNKEAEYQRILAEQIKRRDFFQKEIEDYEAQLQFILNPKLLPKEGSAVLSWPLKYVLITSRYGSRWGRFHSGTDFRAAVGTPIFAMASGIVEGVGDTDIDCKGASFGKWVFIKYNNGLSSTFGHLSVISVKKGQQVKAGSVVGLSGNTGFSTAPHLHVSVYASTGVNVDTVPSRSCNGKIFTQPISARSAYLDPLLYLPKTTSKMFK